jgi:nucleoside-diphosphate-sugar epimerase
MKKVLITGKNSYIGTSVEKWLLKEPENYTVDTLDVKEESWKQHDFSQYDVVFHVAGIAHVSRNPKLKDLYYKVNRDLTIEVARVSKSAGVKQFIFMSSIIVYGDSSATKRVITRDTIPTPTNFYGDSKLQAEIGLKPLESEEFKIVILRPPMIYGPGSKGNYQKLVKLAKITPIFPDYDNERSMLFVDNFCEFIKLVIKHEESGLFFPQNKEYVKTSELVKMIARENNRKIFMSSFFNPVIKLLIKDTFLSKIFGNLIYEINSIALFEEHYNIVNFNESVSIIERGKKKLWEKE